MWRKRRRKRSDQGARPGKGAWGKGLIVNINKMDIGGVDWSEDKYERGRGSLQSPKVLFDSTLQISIRPCSALAGDNVFNKSDNTPWYSGPTLFEAIDAVEMPPKPTDRPLRLPIQDVYKIGGIGTVPVGKVETGVLERGKAVVFNPSQKSARSEM